MLHEDAFNSDFDGHDDFVQSPHRVGRPHKNASITVKKITEMASHGSNGLSLMPCVDNIVVYCI